MRKSEEYKDALNTVMEAHGEYKKYVISDGPTRKDLSKLEELEKAIKEADMKLNNVKNYFSTN